MRVAALATVVFACLAAQAGNDSSGTISTAIDVRSEDLLVQPPANNWVSYNGDYSGRRYGGLSEIKPDNLANLRAEWVFHARDTGRLEVTPLVVNGMMFVTAANDAFALDAHGTSGVLWHFNTGQEISASPTSYAVAGKQYVAIAAGSDVFSFALP